jgi:predicted MFS family arabinose efflux permease
VQVCPLLNFPDGNARGSVSQIRQFAAINGIVVEGEENIVGLPVHISGSRNNLLRSAFTVHNLGIDIAHLPTIYLVSGLFSIVTGPLVGRASDAFGKYPTFVFGCAMTVVMVLIYTHLGHVSLATAITVNVLMFVGIFSRMIPSQALISAIPDPSQRGSFSAVSASLQQLSGGLGSVFAAAIISQQPDGSLLHFERIGYVVVTTTIITLVAMYFVQKSVANRAGRRVV